MTISSDEPELRALMLAGLDGDEVSHKSLLTKLSAYLRAYHEGHESRPADGRQGEGKGREENGGKAVTTKQRCGFIGMAPRQPVPPSRILCS